MLGGLIISTEPFYLRILNPFKHPNKVRRPPRPSFMIGLVRLSSVFHRLSKFLFLFTFDARGPMALLFVLLDLSVRFPWSIFVSLRDVVSSVTVSCFSKLSHNHP